MPEADSIHVPAKIRPPRVEKIQPATSSHLPAFMTFEVDRPKLVEKRAGKAIFSTDEKLFPDLIKRNGQEVKVLFAVAVLPHTRPIDEPFRIEFPDGFIVNAFRNELVCIHDEDENAEDCILATGE